MRRFSFRLEKLLGIRRHREELLEIELGRAVGRCIRIQHEIDRRMAERRRILTQTGSDDIRAEFAKGVYVYRMEKEAGKLRKELVEAEKVRERAKQKFLEASRERKVLDKLKERRQTEYNRAQKAEEIKTSDDLVNANYGRGR
ncbi:MAG: flagellar export protein FliJ [Spirochaetales bacterium]|nr:flagellar export protein FliJ [Spirochaetales bacterium]